MKMKKCIPFVLFFLMGFTGLGILLYPTLSNYRNERMQEKMVDEYRKKAEALEQAAYDEMVSQADRYNEKLFSEGIDFEYIKNYQAELENEGLIYEQILKVEDSTVMGYLMIDKLDLCLTIGYGTSDEVLENSVGHMEGTSLPVGGTNTHAVLFGHRGLPSAKLFTDLDQMEVGDRFEIHVLNRSLTYEVDQILVVTPEITENLKIEEGKDYVTLVTCTPYAVNTHRLLIRGVRVLE